MYDLYVAEFDNGDKMTGYALFIPVLPYTGAWRQITGAYQRILDAFNARNKLLEFDEVDFFRAYQRTF
jgi:hypothetical protein